MLSSATPQALGLRTADLIRLTVEATFLNGQAVVIGAKGEICRALLVRLIVLGISSASMRFVRLGWFDFRALRERNRWLGATRVDVLGEVFPFVHIALTVRGADSDMPDETGILIGTDPIVRPFRSKACCTHVRTHRLA
jgi:hypothetical protein